MKGDTKAAAVLAAQAEFDKVVAGQPVHARDRAEAFANLDAHLALLADPVDGECVGVSMNGSIWVENPTAGPERVRSAGSSCSVSVGPKA